MIIINILVVNKKTNTFYTNTANINYNIKYSFSISKIPNIKMESLHKVINMVKPAIQYSWNDRKYCIPISF